MRVNILLYEDTHLSLSLSLSFSLIPFGEMEMG